MYHESKANTHVQQWAWVVCTYCGTGLPEPRFQYVHSTPRFFFFANAWLPGEIKVIELAEMTAEFCLQLNAPV